MHIQHLVLRLPFGQAVSLEFLAILKKYPSKLQKKVQNHMALAGDVPDGDQRLVHSLFFIHANLLLLFFFSVFMFALKIVWGRGSTGGSVLAIGYLYLCMAKSSIVGNDFFYRLL